MLSSVEGGGAEMLVVWSFSFRCLPFYALLYPIVQKATHPLTPVYINSISKKFENT